MSPPPTELAAPSEVDRCSGNGLGHMLLSPPDPAWPALGKSSSPEPPSAGPEEHNARHPYIRRDLNTTACAILGFRNKHASDRWQCNMYGGLI